MLKSLTELTEDSFQVVFPEGTNLQEATREIGNIYSYFARDLIYPRTTSEKSVIIVGDERRIEITSVNGNSSRQTFKITNVNNPVTFVRFYDYVREKFEKQKKED